jgi:cupin 2 domain-containing protein
VIRAGRLFEGLPAAAPEELVEDLLAGGRFVLKRIVSTGQATPPGAWCDQDEDEWVVLLTGSAGLLIEGEPAVRRLDPGDWLLLPAHCRHRVEWTAPERPTVWLALHAEPGPHAVKAID